MTPSDVSVVIPALNEAAEIASCIESALAAGAVQIIVSDGGSEDATREIASELGATIVDSVAGRGTQLNTGANLATGSVLLFLHADNLLHEDCLRQICQIKDLTWGAFEQQIDSPRFIYRLLERGNAARVRWRGTPFGDQATFVCRDLFSDQGGFSDVPLMEDVILAKKLKRIAKPVLLPGPLSISCRRWEKRGVLRQTLLNWRIQVAHRLGASPQKLMEWYR